MSRELRLEALARGLGSVLSVPLMSLIYGLGQMIFTLIDGAQGVLDDLRYGIRGRG